MSPITVVWRGAELVSIGVMPPQHCHHGSDLTDNISTFSIIFSAFS